MSSRIMRATIDGVTYEIPEIWVAGFCLAVPGRPARTVLDAVQWWHAQRVMALNDRPRGG